MRRPNQGGWRALPGVIFSVLIIAAIAAGALYISTQKTDMTSLSNTGGPPADLVAVKDGLPSFEGQADYQPAVYSGGDSMTAVYFSEADVEQIATFYQQQMIKDGWKQIDAPHPIINANPKKLTSASYEFKASKDNHTVTITAAETDKDLTAGTTETTVKIERN
jgi:hypothetical protein